MAGYTRNDTPNNIAASDLDGEFDAIEDAFNGTTGHSHDGSSGAGPQIAAGGIASNAVTTAKILDANVTTAKIADNNVTTAKILDASVTTAKIAADAIDGTKIADDVIDSEHYTAGSIDAEHLASDSVTTAKILDANVTTAKILDANVTTAKIAADAIDGTKIADDVIDSEHYVAGSIDGEHLAADIIDGTKIADDVIDSEHYVAGSIDAEHLASNSVTSAKLDTNIQVAGTLGVTGETTLTTHLNMGDNDIIKLGDSADLQIYHDGASGASYIAETGASNLILLGTNFRVNNAGNTQSMIVADDNGKVQLHYAGSGKLETTNTGIDVTGTASATTFSGDLNGTINTATTAATQTAGDNTTKVATTAFVTTAVNNAEPFPSGTSMLFQQTAAPTGWTKQTTHNDKALRIVNGTVGTGGTTAFSTALGSGATVAGGSVSGDPGTNQTVSAGDLAVSISGNIANTTLTTNQIPSHSHSIALRQSTGALANNIVGFSGNTGLAGTNTGNTGGGGSHNHGHNLSGSMTGSPTLSGNVTAGNLAVGASTAAINVNYVDFIIANKD
jgi:hypothetical protein